MRTITKMLCLVVLGLSLASITGCSSSGGEITADQIRKNMTPELANINQSSEQHKSDLARIVDNNTRAAWNDMDRVLGLHHNSRLTPWPVP